MLIRAKEGEEGYNRMGAGFGGEVKILSKIYPTMLHCFKWDKESFLHIDVLVKFCCFQHKSFMSSFQEVIYQIIFFLCIFLDEPNYC